MSSVRVGESIRAQDVGSSAKAACELTPTADTRSMMARVGVRKCCECGNTYLESAMHKYRRRVRNLYLLEWCCNFCMTGQRVMKFEAEGAERV